MGNYKGFGDSKILPNLTSSAFGSIVKASRAFKDEEKTVSGLWDDVSGPMFALSDREKQLGLGEKGVTTYFSDNCDGEDAEKVNR